MIFKKARLLHHAYGGWVKKNGFEHYLTRRTLWKEVAKLDGINKIDENPCLFSGLRLTAKGLSLVNNYGADLEIDHAAQDTEEANDFDTNRNKNLYMFVYRSSLFLFQVGSMK